MDYGIWDIGAGAPRGSCLAPLSSSSISMIFHKLSKILPCPCADDTSLSYQSHDLTQLNEAVNSDLRQLDT